MNLPKYLLLIIAITSSLFINNLSAQNVIKPVISGDFADPSIIKAMDTYFAIGTSSEWAPHFPVYASSDLMNWKQTGYVFDKAPEWTSGSFWAPEYYYQKGTYFIYYTARRKKDNISCIGVATSKFPDKGFTDHGVIIEHGMEAIDGFVFVDNGIKYITYKAYGLDKRPIEILGVKLSDDGLKIEGETFSMMKDDAGKGLEGQSFMKVGDYYYMFYSAGGCCGIQCDYNVGVARSKSFKGPYEKYTQNPILAENESWKCSGHGTFVKTEQGKNYYLYHAYNKETTVFAGRQGMLAELTWPEKKGWPKFKEISGSNTSKDGSFNFNDKTPDKSWQWDFRNSIPKISQENGKLNLSGSIAASNLAGIVLTIRPTSAIFEATTTVSNSNNALKGISYYGDAGAAIGVGITGNQVQFWKVQNKQKTILASQTINKAENVELKLKVATNLEVTTFYKEGQEDWKILNSEVKVNVNFLPQWDRSPRIGLNFNGKPEEVASFTNFNLKYQ
ncbi:glycoside hydrolase family 43 protein [Pedobacter aquatilis]|uniref:glycoside hydrolase family 43 protein n=1 Tax=Pedobacter aquatilis TaxID=351343 RepID=UPI0025B5D689|nr:glycoside hydrolase family 43 protein [Pedobacter aquatilis]MDN3588294.1 glycoside hydrolase family 43 protein [Pedobacter aquatilis]